jgi:hypothetical protein
MTSHLTWFEETYLIFITLEISFSGSGWVTCSEERSLSGFNFFNVEDIYSKTKNDLMDFHEIWKLSTSGTL